MPTFEIEKDGKTFEIDAPNQAAAIAGLARMASGAGTPANDGSVLAAPNAENVGRFASEAYAKSPIPAAVGLVQGAANVVAHPLDTYLGAAPIANTVKELAKAQWDQAVQAAQKAKEATSGGGVLSASEALGHGLAAILPILGPAAANVGEHGAKGDIAGMLGGATGLLTPFAAKAGLELKNSPNASKADLVRRDAEQTVSQRVLAPGNPRFKGTAEKIAPEVLSRGLQGSRLELQQLADEGMAAAADKIDAAIQSRGPSETNLVSTRAVADALNERIDGMRVNGKDIPTNAGKIAQLEKLRDYLVSVGPKLPFDEVRKIRDDFYGAADAAKGYQGPDVNMPDIGWAAREAGSAIREQLAKDRPELVGPNADYTFFKRLGDVLDPTLGRPKLVNGTPTGITGGLATAGAVAGLGTKIPGASLVLSRLLPAIQNTVNSPAWQLAKASKKYALADAIEAGSPGQIKSALVSIAQGAPREQENGQ